MYTQEDLFSITKQLKKRWVLLALPEVVMLAGLIYSLTQRMEWLTTLLTCAMGGTLIFCYDLMVKPLRCYQQFLRGALEGRTRILEGVFKYWEQGDSTTDGVVCRGMIVSAGNPADEEDDRLFYYDTQKELPSLEAGQRIKITYHDRAVAALEVL